MAKSLNPEQMQDSLERGSFDECIGVVEDHQLECKKEPYQMRRDDQRQEFAKDVTALANAEGGVILIGVRTEKNPTHFGDEITSIHPFPQDLVNPDQWDAILQTWVYPSLQGVNIRWYPSASDPQKGIIAIYVPKQSSTQRPFLVTRTIDDQGKRVETVFGYFERRQAHVGHSTVQALHALLQNGFRYDDVVTQRLDDMWRMLQELRSAREHEVQAIVQRNISALLSERIEHALTAVNLQEQPVFILAATPMHPVNIPSLFTSTQADIVHLLEHPPQLRPYGFGWRTEERARIVQGQLRRVMIPEYKILDLWQEGTLIAAGIGNGSFLSWGSDRPEKPLDILLINPTVFIESTYVFAELSKRVFSLAQPLPRGVEYRIELRNMTVNGKPCKLGRLMDGPWRGVVLGMYGNNAPASEAVFSVKWDEVEIDPKVIAFLLVRRFLAKILPPRSPPP